MVMCIGPDVDMNTPYSRLVALSLGFCECMLCVLADINEFDESHTGLYYDHGVFYFYNMRVPHV